MIPAERVTPRPLTAGVDSRAMSPRTLAACAAALLLIDDARIYGLIDGGPEVDRGRCQEILKAAKRHRIVCSQDEIEAKALSLMAELGGVRR